MKAKARKNFLSLRLKLVAVSSVESVLRGVVIRAVGITGSIALTHDADSFGEFWGDADGYFQNSLVTGVSRLLGQITRDGILIHLDTASIRVLFLEDHFEKGGLASPIGPNQRDAFAPVDGHVCVLEKRAPSKGFGKFSNDEHVG